MTTECTTERLEFGGLRRQRVVGRFDGGELGSDGGGLLLRELAQRTGLFGRLSACFRDYREPQRTRHPVEVLVAARVLGLALGYEDLNDHDTLRQSKLWSLLCGGGGTGPALDAGERYKKIVADTARLDALLVDLFLDWHGEQPERIVLDVDATDDPLHGRQEGRFFHGYYRSYCYLPLYIFCGQQLLGARLRTADRDAADGTVEELERIVGRIRKRWPGVAIWLRRDSGFCRDELLAWCEAQGVEYVLGIAQNPRLKRSLAPEMERARQECERTGQAARVFKDFRYRTLDSWSRERRVIGKAEHLPRGANPRFVVTSLGAERMAARALYEEVYCARGDMENRIVDVRRALVLVQRGMGHDRIRASVTLDPLNGLPRPLLDDRLRPRAGLAIGRLVGRKPGNHELDGRGRPAVPRSDGATVLDGLRHFHLPIVNTHRLGGASPRVR